MTAKSMDCKTSSPSNKIWWISFALLCGATFVTRFYKVLEPDHVCWDETHFGKMASWYINRTFFFDVHPPLGKMLIALSGKLTGYDGTFPFEKPGDKYNGARYEGMRIFCTTLGALVVPLTFLTLWEMTGALDAALAGAGLLLCDVGFLTLSRYILLDPILLFFMSCSVYGAFKTRSSRGALRWQLFTGAALACTLSVKFVGLFTALFVGLRTAADLWESLGDLAQPAGATLRRLAVRSATLIAWPALLYVLLFWVHLRVLHRSGNGDGFYSSGFQARLLGNGLHAARAPRALAYGAVVTLKNHRTGGGYLHSHRHLYPAGVGARQQQVTTYSHKDDNNRWLVRPPDGAPPAGPQGAVRLVRGGDLLRLTHVATGRNLHAHAHPAPLSERLLQVTGYGEDGVGDANDVWRVLLSGGRDGDEVRTVRSKLVLVHALQGCALTAPGRQLPAWGFEQQEVACTHNLRDPHALWNVEDNRFDALPQVSFEEYASGFLERFLESHAVMLQGNAGLKPKEGEATSQPWQWPLNYRGQFFSGGAHRVYLLGNPAVWWGNAGLLALWALAAAAAGVRGRRARALGRRPARADALLRAAGWACAGWALHYAPFWAMGRVLYFHHYFPALVFSCMASGALLARLARAAGALRPAALGAAAAAAAYGFRRFAPLAYGMGAEPDPSVAGLRWLDSWEF